MNTYNFMPEGWDNEVTKINKENINHYIETNETLQGLVKKCDENNNLHIGFENGLTGIIPMKEVEGINLEPNGLPKENLCTGKVNRFVQFKVKEINEENIAILSRKDVQKQALNWVKQDLQEGKEVNRNCKKH